jgi:uncharacterized protein (UPF0276 family)
VNNIHVSGENLGFDPAAYLDALPGTPWASSPAGHAVNDADGQTVLIDDHGSPVTAEVWASTAGRWPLRAGADAGGVGREHPPLTVLLAEAARATACARVAPRPMAMLAA